MAYLHYNVQQYFNTPQLNQAFGTNFTNADVNSYMEDNHTKLIRDAFRAIGVNDVGSIWLDDWYEGIADSVILEDRGDPELPTFCRFFVGDNLYVFIASWSQITQNSAYYSSIIKSREGRR